MGLSILHLLVKSLGVIALLGICLPAQAQLGVVTPKERFAVKAGFAFPKQGAVKIIVFRPDVRVGEEATGGINQPNADWTNEARTELTKALSKANMARNNEMTLMPELSGEGASVMANYRALFLAVADAVMTHKLFPGNRLPTKKEAFDWTLGAGAQELGRIGGGDYGLFVYTYDSYGSAGRKAAAVFSSLLGAPATSGKHVGYAGLIDLKSGDLLWMNVDIDIGGDVRTREGAEKRVSQLLQNFPSHAGTAAAAVK
jgi:hypothetical protein